PEEVKGCKVMQIAEAGNFRCGAAAANATHLTGGGMPAPADCSVSTGGRDDEGSATQRICVRHISLGAGAASPVVGHYAGSPEQPGFRPAAGARRTTRRARSQG